MVKPNNMYKNMMDSREQLWVNNFWFVHVERNPASFSDQQTSKGQFFSPVL